MKKIIHGYIRKQEFIDLINEKYIMSCDDAPGHYISLPENIITTKSGAGLMDNPIRVKITFETYKIGRNK